MSDTRKEVHVGDVPYPVNSPWLVSRRTFLGMVAAARLLNTAQVAAPASQCFTDFGDDGNPVDLVPRLTPAPETIAGIAKPQIDLNGTWHFNPNPSTGFWKDQSEAGWSDIQVPAEWTMRGFSVKPGQAAGYRLRFPVPADWAGYRIKVRFDAVYSKTNVWMNGAPVGAHLGAFTPFEVDVSDAVLPGKDNVLALAVASESLADTLTAGREMVGHPIGGIIRKVRILAVPELNIASLHVETTFDGEFRNATLRVLIEIANDGPKDVASAELAFALREHGPGGKPVNLDPAIVKLPKIMTGQTLPRTIEIPIREPKKWDAEHPNLYLLNCELKLRDKPYSAQRRFGFRQVNIKDGRFLLNGQPIRLRGVSRQDTHPLTGRTIAPEIHRQDIDYILWANCNNTYTCAFLPDEEILNLCDEAGIYVLDEPGTCYVGEYGHDVEGRNIWEREKSDDPKYFPFYLQPVLEMIERDRSHPSVITWMLADESRCGKNFLEVLKMVRAIEPSRPVHMAWDPESKPETAGLELIPSPFDLGNWHYVTKKQFDRAALSRRPVIFDQSSSVYFVNVPELMTDPGLHEEWGQEYARFWEKIWETPSMLGAQVFNLNDDQYLIPSGLVTGNGDFGLIDCWRRAKPPLWHVKKAHTPIKIHDGPIPLPAAGGLLEVPVENRYDFSDLAEVQIEWSLGDESGTVQAHVPPHRKGTISIRPNGTDLKGQALSLKFFREGRMIDVYRLLIGEAREPAAAVQPKAGRRVELVQANETMTVRGEGFEWVISRQTGQIIKATRKGRTVLQGGPILMVLPAKEYVMIPGYPKPRPKSFSPLNATCQDWKATSVSARRLAGEIEIHVTGQYKEAAGSYTLRISGDGEATLRYHFTYTDEKITPLQVGMVFYTSRECDSLSWRRKSLWSVYPEDHIGRPEGVAKALPDPGMPARGENWMEVAYREKPTWPWSLDANALGTRDFRATRRNILHASLQDSSGSGITVLSDGTQDTRCFLDGNRIGLLVASYSGPGGQAFWLKGLPEIAGVEIMTLPEGAELKDTVHLSTRPNDSETRRLP